MKPTLDFKEKSVYYEQNSKKTLLGFPINRDFHFATTGLSGLGGKMKINFIYMTVGSKDEARKIGKELVTSRLAACVNILDNMNSFYMWEGEIQDDTEVVMIAKTSEERVPQLVEKVKSLHSYDCPCIVSLPVLNGYQPFLEWIAVEVTF